MNTPSVLRLAALVLAAALGFAPAAGLAQSAGKEMKPPKVTKTTVVDLGPEFEAMQGRQLRMRVVTVEPGAGHAEHSHKDRPEVAYVIAGTITEMRGGKTTELRAGDTWTAGKETTHELQNKGKEPVTLVVVDLFKPQ